MARDEEFEEGIKQHRDMQRLLKVDNIHFKAKPRYDKRQVRHKLSRPDFVQFFWRPADDPEKKKQHCGYVMVAFDSKANMRTAETELRGLKINGREITITRASRWAFEPQRQRTRSAALATTFALVAPTTGAPTGAAPTASSPASSALNTAGFHDAPGSHQRYRH
ncbi:hypothetical protein S7711_10404 [Stachybotrys chartarum IBT 7711]|uniref:RRM domain-containing protein n=1 Tax=Stachybotrys chartarum (strain CBS 109288 / IBT 7711) TaxID=1280523 RepID=A0A084B478_STACB|nr:hypothetical protein S7711_10404 [Stachybotrys chartarum IBT 7711]